MSEVGGVCVRGYSGCAGGRLVESTAVGTLAEDTSETFACVDIKWNSTNRIMVFHSKLLLC